MLKIGVIGGGKWGQNHLKDLSKINDCQLIGLADSDPGKKELADSYCIRYFSDFKSMLPEVDAVTIVTPTTTHYPLAKYCLEQGKHVFVEKPLCFELEQSEELVNLARSKNLILSVGYVFRFNPLVQRLKQLLPEIGPIQYITGRYVHSTVPPRKDSGVIFNLGVHLLDLLNYILPDNPTSIFCRQTNLISNQHEDSSTITLNYSSFFASLEISCCHPHKKRDMWIVGQKKKLYLDFLDQILIHYPLIITEEKTEASEYFRDPEIEKTSPLFEELNHFCQVSNQKKSNPGQDITNHSSENLLTTKLCLKALESAKTSQVVNLSKSPNPPKQIVFMGSKEIGCECLNYLVQNKANLNVEVAGVLTNERSLFSESSNKFSIKQLCLKNNILLIDSLDNYLKLNDFDILISVQYHEILKAQHISKAKQIAVNLHMAPLPEYRGCNQFSFALVDGAKEFGTTLHKLEEGIDSGPILFERRFPIPDGCWVKELYQLTFEESVNLFQENIGKIINGDYCPIPQFNFRAQRSTSLHFRKEIDSLKQIDLSWSKEKVARYFRATYFPPFDPPFSMVDGKKFNLTWDWYEQLMKTNVFDYGQTTIKNNFKEGSSMKFKNKTILVTGGAGFIGSHIIDRCLEEGAEKVISLDNYVAGRMENVAHLKDNPKVELITGDVTDFKLIKSLVNRSDYIFHQAASKFVVSMHNPREDMETNIIGTFNLLEAARLSVHKPRIIHASTGSVLGNSDSGASLSETDPLKPTSPYGISKSAAESYVLFYAKQFGVRATALRYFHVYGPRQAYDGEAGVVSIFLAKVLQGKSPTIFGDGSQVRCFTSVYDDVEANILLAMNDDTIGQVYNVASKERVTVLDLAQTIIGKYGPKGMQAVFGPERIGENKNPIPDTSKIEGIGFKAKYGFSSGLELTKQWVEGVVSGK